ncbi:GNAT family N-acetyltransferase [Paenibacillus puerhi]|uniref:GNAT family N-acetyltransferase n=1 Tax=Paenibacillus puerhi TaxID=2692622 RepID=UPI00135738A1|nr:GNAT family N-acetyltransferase [Paenibacillus puerhi]
MDIRLAALDDVPSILEIYNEAIVNTVATFDTVPRTLEQQQEWFAQHGDAYPVLVAEIGGIIAGWSALNRYSDRLAYARTSELSLYIRDEYRGQGIGRELLERMLREGKQAGLHTILSRIEESNEASLHLHRAYGFEQVGTLREVGVKFGRLLNVVLMQKML